MSRWSGEDLNRDNVASLSFRFHGELQDRRLLLELIKSCGVQKDLNGARKVHRDVIQNQAFLHDICINNALLSMYVKCGAITEARRVFNQIASPNVVSWNALISGYGQHELGHEALKCFNQMQDEGMYPDAVTYICILKVCGNKGFIEVGEDMHAKIKRQGFLRNDIVLGTTLVNMYAKCGMMGKAHQVFEELPVRNVVSWSAMISGYVLNGCGEEALSCFMKMRAEGISPDVVTFVSILKACSEIGCLEVGEKIHVEIRILGLLERNIILGSALLSMYAKCNMMEKAQKVFDDELPTRDVASWNVLIAGYVHVGLDKEALKYFMQMLDHGLFPNRVILISILKACGNTRNFERAEELIKKYCRNGLFEIDSVLGTTLVDMYAKCDMIEKSQEVFDKMSVRDVVSWTALISGYVQHGLSDEALSYFRKMQLEGISPNAVTFISALKACGNIGYLEMGEEIHSEVSKRGLLELDIVLHTALVDMYSKCGILGKAHKLFRELPMQNVVSWNALMSGCAQMGQVRRVSDLLREMIEEGLFPDLVTFLILLHACNYDGLVEKGQLVFGDINAIFHRSPTIEHYTCMVDLLSRAGLYRKAIDVIEQVQASDRLPLLLALLGTGNEYINVEIGRWAFEQSIQLNSKCHTPYIYMGNMYAVASMNATPNKINARTVEMED